MGTLNTQPNQLPKLRSQGGRPPMLDIERRSIKFHGGFTYGEAELIAEKAIAAGVTESEYIRHAVLQRELKTVPAINKDAYHELGKIGVNINQCARLINGGSNANAELAQALSQLKIVITQLRQELLGVLQ